MIGRSFSFLARNAAILYKVAIQPCTSCLFFTNTNYLAFANWIFAKLLLLIGKQCRDSTKTIAIALIHILCLI